jgi:drug/metabolite transporter (DMT)-like permease
LKTRSLQADGLLLLTSLLWGFAFVAQRVGMDSIGPFAFNGIRFALGGVVLLPLVARNGWKLRQSREGVSPLTGKTLLLGGILTGMAIFGGASFQQVGLVYTTAGKAGFITGLYVVIVPILGLLWNQRSTLGTWLGAILAAAGLYFLSVTESFTISLGDFLELVGAFFWAAHVLLLSWLSPRTHPATFAFLQYAACSVLSLLTAGLFETVTTAGLVQAALPILYGGLVSVGIAYTLQVVALRSAHPAHAAILLSLEAVFAAFAGWLLLGEVLTARGFAGCALMLAGMLLSQLWGLSRFAEGGKKR